MKWFDIKPYQWHVVFNHNSIHSFRISHNNKNYLTSNEREYQIISALTQRDALKTLLSRLESVFRLKPKEFNIYAVKMIKMYEYAEDTDNTGSRSCIQIRKKLEYTISEAMVKPIFDEERLAENGKIDLYGIF